ncbi:MAG: EpsG family protein [Erysipelotrichia bacterium]|nr:EpsG family protein [Erysipelotrichia bacterium]
MSSLLIYISVFTVSSMMISIYSEKRKMFDLFSLIGLSALVLFAAGRYFVGTDFVTYCLMFERFAKTEWNSFFDSVSSEYLFAAIAKITYAKGGHALTYGTFAFLFLMPVYCTLKKQYQDISLATTMFVFCFSAYALAFNITREYIAVAIVFYSLKYVFNNRFISFAICIFIATLFHKSAFIALILWILWNHKYNITIKGFGKALVILATVVFVFYYQDIIKFIFGDSEIFSDYLGYAAEGKAGLNRDFYLSLLETIVILLFYKVLAKDRYYDDRIDYMILLSVIALLIGITGFFHPQVKRIAYYFSMPANLILFGYMPKYSNKKYAWLIQFLIIVYFVSKFVLTSYILDQGDLIPYEFDLTSDYADDPRNYYVFG